MEQWKGVRCMVPEAIIWVGSYHCIQSQPLSCLYSRPSFLYPLHTLSFYSPQKGLRLTVHANIPGEIIWNGVALCWAVKFSLCRTLGVLSFFFFFNVLEEQWVRTAPWSWEVKFCNFHLEHFDRKASGLCLEQFNSFRTLSEQGMKFKTRHIVCAQAFGNVDCWYLNNLLPWEIWAVLHSCQWRSSPKLLSSQPPLPKGALNIISLWKATVKYLIGVPKQMLSSSCELIEGSSSLAQGKQESAGRWIPGRKWSSWKNSSVLCLSVEGPWRKVVGKELGMLYVCCTSSND